MARFLCLHTLPANSITRQQVEQITQAAQRDPVIKGVRSFISASEGKVACIMESPDKQSLSNWYKKMDLPVDSICQVEFEGDRGNVQVLGTQAGQQQQQQGQQQQSYSKSGA